MLRKHIQALVCGALMVTLACADNVVGPGPGDPSPVSSAASGGAQAPLFTLVAAPVLNANQQSVLASIRSQAYSAEVHIALLTSAPALLLQLGKSVVFDVSPTTHFVAVGEQVSQRGPQDISWRGQLQKETGSVQLVLTDKGVVGTLRTSTTLYEIMTIGGGFHAIVRVEETKVPPEGQPGDPTSAPNVAPGSSIGGALSTRASSFPALPNGTPSFATASSNMVDTQIDVLVVYTASAAAVSGGNIGANIQLAIDQTNTSYSNSGIGIHLVNVHSAEVSYDENNRSYVEHVAALQGTSDGLMDIVHTWRDQYVADVVVLLVYDTELCGRASVIQANAASAFAAVGATCPLGTYTFAHEVGHLQGARHDRFVDNTNTPFQHGHGYVDPNRNWRTIMAYEDVCLPYYYCPPVQYWSSPNVTYPPTGQVMGTAAYEDDARVLRYTAETVSEFRGGWSVSITGPSYIADQRWCTWTANVSNGVPPYTYSWYVQPPANGYFWPVTGTQPTFETQGTSFNYTGQFVVTVTVTSANGASKTAGAYATVYSSGGPYDPNYCH